MSRKRSPDEERCHLLKKLKRLERKINSLPETEDDLELEEGEIGKENYSSPGPEEILIEDHEENSLDDDILNILGVPPAPIPKKETLHKEVADRWSEILNKGLKNDEKEPLCNENRCFENVPKMVAPKLNKEVAAAMNDGAKKRDRVIEERQKNIATALSCVGQALQLLCTKNMEDDKLTLIKKINDAGRLLCDSLYRDTKGRRTLILSTINKDLKDFLLETDTGEYLFGENLSDRIKAARAVQRSGKELKMDDKNNISIKRNEVNEKRTIRTLNWRGPPRVATQQRSQRTGGAPAFKRQTFPMKKEDRVTTSRRGRK